MATYTHFTLALTLAGTIVTSPLSAVACNYSRYGLSPGDDSQATVDGLFRGEYNENKEWRANDWRQQVKLVSDDATDLAGKLDLAWALHMAGERQQAVALYEELLKPDPDNYEVLCSYATILQHYRVYDRAAALLKQAIALKPGFRNRAEEFHLDMIEYKAKSRQDPNFARENIFVPELTSIWNNRKGVDENLSTVQFPDGFNSTGMAELLRQYPDYGEAWLALGMLLEHEEDFSLAAKAYDRALDNGTAHRDEVKKYMATFREFGREHDAGRVVARGIKRLLIGGAILVVLLYLYRVAARVIWDVSSHRAMKQDEKRRRRRKEDNGPL